MYIAPDTVIPAASAIAALVGTVLMYGRRSLGAGRLIVRRAVGR